MKKKLAIITSHPIQYNAPLFELLQQRNNINLHVFYTWGKEGIENKYDPGFKKEIVWDIPLLNGYNYSFIENVANDKGTHHFLGIQNPSLIKSIEDYCPDAIMVYGWAFKSHLKVLRYFKNKIPILFRGDSTLLDPLPYFKYILRIVFLRWVYSKIDYALYVGENNRKYFKLYGLKKNQLVFAGHAVENARFSCETEECKNEAVNFRKLLNIDQDDFVFLYAGKLENKKGVELLLKAFESALFNKKVHLVVVGSGELEFKLKNTFSNNRNIHFKDFVNQSLMPCVYGSSDVFVLPSAGPGETWGLAVNEAMAASKPVIVSDKCGCAKDLINNIINGFVFAAGNVTELRDYMNWFVTNRDKISKMGINSKDIIENYSLINIATSIEDILMKEV